MQGNILINSEIVEATDVNVTDHIKGFEDFQSVAGRLAIPIDDIASGITFKVELSPGKDVTAFLDSVNGEQVVASSEMFKTFRGRLTRKKHDVKGGQTFATYDVEIKEYSN